MLRIKQAVKYLKADLFSQHNLFMLIVYGIIFFSIISSITNMDRNWRLEQKISNVRLEKKRLELEIDKLHYEQDYYKSSEYQELMARAKQDKKLPGETMVYLPNNSMAAKTKDRRIAIMEQEHRRSNLRAWLDFLF